MKLKFTKYHGAGNDFILADNRDGSVQLSKEQIARLCHRRFGIGADGLILIQPKKDYDFEMKYFNADGGEGSMCGNGGRCAVIFAGKLGMISKKAKLLAFDGAHEAVINEDDTVRISMLPVQGFDVNLKGDYVLETGSPHYIQFVENTTEIDVYTEGFRIRHNEQFYQDGINVNFVSLGEDSIKMRTYERGVEDETLSCGTGTVAVAIAVANKNGKMGQQEYHIQAPGGELVVYFNRTGEKVFEDIWLEGPVSLVYEGSTNI